MRRWSDIALQRPFQARTNTARGTWSRLASSARNSAASLCCSVWRGSGWRITFLLDAEHLPATSLTVQVTGGNDVIEVQKSGLKILRQFARELLEATIPDINLRGGMAYPVAVSPGSRSPGPPEEPAARIATNKSQSSLPAAKLGNDLALFPCTRQARRAAV
jgi:hypothetical protein